MAPPLTPIMPGSWDLGPPSPIPTPTFDQQELSPSYMTSKLLSRRKEYLSQIAIRIKVGSWNIGDFDCAKDLADWFGVSGEGPEDTYDIYALGLQEVVDVTNTQNFLRYIDPKIALNWKAHAQVALPAGYECVASTQLIGVLLMVFVSPKLAKSSVATSTVGTGLMGYVGNKGGVGIRIVLGDTLRLVFVNCHLAAFANAWERRNWDASEIQRRMAFDAVSREVVGLDESTDPATLASEGIDKADVVLWCGDLNYRVDLDNTDIRALLQPFMPKDLPPTHADISHPASPIEDHEPKLPPNPTEVHPNAAATLEGTVESLLKHDQLWKQRQAGKAFKGYREGKVTFLPTYKYDVGTEGTWDSSEKARAPSWCDRVLWRVKCATEDETKEPEDSSQGIEDGKNLDTIKKETLFEATELVNEEDDEDDLVVTRAEPEPAPPPRISIDARLLYDEPTSAIETPFGEIKLELLSYKSHQPITSSDHKPLSATFTLSYPASDPSKRATVHTEIAREIDKLENERRPVVTVLCEDSHDYNPDSPSLSFGPVRFLEPKTLTLTIANTGTTPAELSFIPSGSEPDKPWLKVPFTPTTLKPGDTLPVPITLSITTLPLVRSLSSDSETLEDVLILRAKDGRDTFLPVSATWLPTCYGVSMAELIRVPESSGGYRAYRASDDTSPSKPLFSAPREIYRLTDHILSLIRVTPTAVVYFSARSPSQDKLAEMWDAVDTDAPTLPADIEAAIETLIMLLSALPEPIVDWTVVEKLKLEDAEKVLDQMPRAEVNTWMYMVGWLGEVVTVTGVKSVLTEVGKVLVRREGEGEVGKKEAERRGRWVEGWVS